MGISGPETELLSAYVRADSDAEARAELSSLFAEHIIPWCRDAARRALRNYGLRGRSQSDEEAEVVAEVSLRITGRLHGCRRGSSPPVDDLRAYVTSSIYNACFARVRARCPNHVQLQNRIRYLLRHDADFAAWSIDGAESMAGLRGWTGRQDAVTPIVPQRSDASLRDVVRSIFRLSGGPVRLTDLVGAAAESLGILEPTAADGEHLAVAEPGADRVMIQREELSALWSEVLQLSAPQRTALLLNLRDAAGHGVIELIPATGTASLEQLAQVLSLSAEALATIWADLPLEDAKIAEMMGLSRQQVINLRKAARERLARRQKQASGNTRLNSASTLVRS